MAKALADAFCVSVDYFANLQKAYDISRAREPDPGVARRAMLQGAFPIREMIRRGWLIDTDADLLEAQLTRFFRKNDLSDVPYMPHAAKKREYDDAEDSETLRIQMRSEEHTSELQSLMRISSA